MGSQSSSCTFAHVGKDVVGVAAGHGPKNPAAHDVFRPTELGVKIAPPFPALPAKARNFDAVAADYPDTLSLDDFKHFAIAHAPQKLGTAPSCSKCPLDVDSANDKPVS